VNKLSEQLMDAHMIGNKDLIQSIQEKIDSKYAVPVSTSVTTSTEANSILNRDHVSAIKIHDYFDKIFGDDWFDLEPETIDKLLFTNYGIVLEDAVRDKVFAIKHICQSDRCFKDWFLFNQVTLALSGCIADFEALRTPSSGMIINAVKCMNYIRPDCNSEFSDEVLKFISIALVNDGIYTPPLSLVLILKGVMGQFAKNTKSKWVDILRRFTELVKNPKLPIEEDSLVDIQARRLVRAEAAALQYGV